METKNDYSVAIDIGSTKVIVLVGQKSNEGKIRIIAGATEPLGDGDVQRGEIRNIKDVTNAVKRCIATIEEEDYIIIKDAIIGVTGQHVYCRKHKESIYAADPNEISEDDLKILIDNAWRSNTDENYFIMDVIPINYSIDNGGDEVFPLGKRGNKLTGNYNILYGDKSKMSYMRTAIRGAGISETSLIPFPIAAGESVLTDDDKSLGVALVDIGSTSTEIAIYCNGVMRFMAALPYGSSLINNDIRAYGVVPRAVESLKLKYGSAVTESVNDELVIEIPTNTASICKPIPGRTLSRIIEARVIEIGKGIKEMISLSGYGPMISNGIVLTGGGSKLRHIDTQFSRVTKMSVRLGLPDFNVDGIDNNSIYDMGYATSIGILVDSLNKEKFTPVNIKEREVVEVQEEVVEKKDNGGKKKKDKKKDKEGNKIKIRKNDSTEKKVKYNKLDSIVKFFEALIGD